MHHTLLWFFLREENLQSVRLRNIPVAAKPSEGDYTGFDQDLIRNSLQVPAE